MSSRVDPLPPFGTDSSSGPSYFSYGASSSSSHGSIARPLPFSAGSYNGGLIAPTPQAQLAAVAANYSRFGGAAKQIVNPISWRSTQSGSSRLNHSSILSKSSTLPSVPGATPSHSLSPLPPPSQPFINQSGDSVSRARTAQGQPTGTFNPATAVPPPTQPTQTRFHRTRSSFIPNKWTRGPGDGTFGSVYLSFGGGGDYNRNSALSFDRKRPEEIWEEEQARKRGMSQSTKKRSKPKTKKKEKRPQGKDAAARKLLAKARNQLLAHLSAPSCRLFSEADHVVAVSDDDLDDLLHAGGGDVNMVIDYLTQFDRDNKKFDTFQQLMIAIQDARKEDGDFGAGTEQDQYESQDQGQGQDQLEDEPMQQPEPDNEYPPDEEEKTAENETHRSDELASSSTQPVSKKTKKREPAAVEKRPAKKAEEDEAKRKTTATRNAPAASRTTKTNEDKKRKEQTTSTLKKKSNSTGDKKEAAKPAEESKEYDSTTESAVDPTTTATTTATDPLDTQHESASDPAPSADPLESPATQPEPTPAADSSSDTPAAATATATSAEPDSSYTPPAEAATTAATDASPTSEPAANQDPDESYGDDFD